MRTVLLKRGRGTPKPDQLKVGEVAIDLAGMRLITKDENGKVVKLIGVVIGPHDKRLYGRMNGTDKLVPLGMEFDR